MTWIETWTGKRFELLNPQPEQVDLADIAHSLARLNRFTGHTIRTYSVAEHSLHCVQLLESEPLRISDPLLLAHALFHDAAEYIVGDVSAPLKVVLRQGPQHSFLDRLEQSVLDVIYAAVGLPPISAEHKRVVKHTDLRMLMTERAVLMPHTGEHSWEINVPPDEHMMGLLRLPRWASAIPETIEWRFLARATALLAQMKGLSSA